MPPDRAPPLILLVEDEPAWITLARIAHSKVPNGGEMIVAHNGLLAIKVLERLREQGRRPSLIITDIEMPSMNGYEFLKWLRTQVQYDDVRRVALSFSRSNVQAAILNLCGSLQFLEKPITAQEFENQIQLCQPAE